MSTRQSVVKIQTLTRSEYNLAKHIPSSIPLKKILPENDGISFPVLTTCKPIISKPSHFDYQSGSLKKAKSVESSDPFSNKEIAESKYLITLTAELENQMKNLTDRSGLERNALESHVEQLKKRITELEAQLNLAEENNEQKIFEYENKIILISNENESLNAILKDKSQEIELWKGKLSSLERAKAQELEETRQRAEEDKKVAIDAKTAELDNRFKVERDQMEAEKKELMNKNREFENTITYITVETERLRNLYENRTKEVEAWKDKYAQLENSRFIEIEEVRIQFETLKRSSLQVSDDEIRFQAERSSYETQIMQLKHKIAELEATVYDREKEIERLNGLYTETKKQAEAFKNKYDALDQSSIGEIDILRRENEQLKKTIWEKDETNMRFEVEKTNYENQIIQLKQVIEANKAEMGKLYALINTRKGETDNQSSQLNTAREEAARLSKAFKELEAEFKMTSQNEQLSHETKLMQLKHKIAELEATVYDHEKENERLNGLYTETKKQAEAFKNKYDALDQSSSQNEESMTKNKSLMRLKDKNSLAPPVVKLRNLNKINP